jgi:hypothetical protein
VTSLRQIEANRRNAVRHGLTAETVVSVLENPEDYKAFELSITSEFDVETAVERELVLRLASLLWRLRRAIAIESGLLRLQSETTDTHGGAENSHAPAWSAQRAISARPVSSGGDDESLVDLSDFQNEEYNNKIARNFVCLAKLDHGAFKRLGRYEMALWRQVGQVLFTLDTLRWKTFRARASSPRAKYADPFWQRREPK